MLSAKLFLELFLLVALGNDFLDIFLRTVATYL